MQTSNENLIMTSTEKENCPLVGREKEKAGIKEAINLSCKGKKSLYILMGEPGCGKTALMRNAINECIDDSKRLIYAKAQQNQPNEPYSIVRQLFCKFINIILSEPNEKMNWYKNTISKEIGKNLKLLDQIIPEICILTDYSRNSIENINVLRSKSILEKALIDFLMIFNNKKNPIILFIDDIHWCDNASLDFIKNICTNTHLKYICILCTARKKEMFVHQHLTKNLLPMKHWCIIKELKQLSFEDTHKLLIAKFKDNENIFHVAKEIYKITLGNPLHILEVTNLIQAKYNDRTNLKAGLDECVIENTYDIDQLIKDRLSNLSQNEIQFLKTASCMNRNFDILLISKINEIDIDETEHICTSLLTKGILLKSYPNYNAESSQVYEFFHDKIQKQAYDFLNKNEKMMIHLKIANLLFEILYKTCIDDHIIEIVNHYNNALDIIGNNKADIILLNLKAGEKSWYTGQYQEGIHYLKIGISLLDDTYWRSESFLITFKLYSTLIQCLFYVNKEEAIQYYKQLNNNTYSDNLKLELYNKMAQLYLSITDMEKAVYYMDLTLMKLNVVPFSKISRIDIYKEAILCMYYFRKSKWKSILNADQITDKKAEKALEVLTNFYPAAKIAPNARPYMALKKANISAKYGNCKASIIGYVGYAAFLTVVLKKYRKAFYFTQKVTPLCEAYDDDRLRCQYYTMTGSLTNYWSMPMRENIKQLENGIEAGIRSGEFLFVAYSASILLSQSFAIGMKLSKHLELWNKYHQILLEERAVHEVEHYRLLKEITLYLFDIHHSSKFFEDDSQWEIKKIKEKNDSLSAYYLLRAVIYYILGDYDKAFIAIEKSISWIKPVKGFYFTSEIYFYYTLIITEIFGELNHKERKKYEIQLKKNLRFMKRCSEACEENFLHKYMLMKAQTSKALGTVDDKLFDDAIKLCEKYDYIQDYAIACECLARHYFSLKRDMIAKVYINEAYHYFDQWEAHRKTLQLREQYGNILDIDNHKYNDDTVKITSASLDISLDTLVANTMREIHNKKTLTDILRSFLINIMQLTKTNRGIIFIEKNNQLYVDVYKHDSEIKSYKRKSFEKMDKIPKRMIRYCERTYQNLIYNYNDSIESFFQDEYINSNSNHPIICIPLKLEDVFLGVLYLEDTTNQVIFNNHIIELIVIFIKQILYIDNFQSSLFNKDDEDMSINKLSKREIDVLELIAKGKSIKEISDELYIGVSTVKAHSTNIYKKLGVSSRIQAVIKAKKLNLV